MASPSLGYGDVTSADLNTVNSWMRDQPWYQDLLKSFGQNPNNVHLNDDEQHAVIKAAQANGIIVNEGHNGQEVDESGNFQAKSHVGRNILIVAGIAGLALTGFGAAGIGPMAGLMGGATEGGLTAADYAAFAGELPAGTAAAGTAAAGTAAATGLDYAAMAGELPVEGAAAAGTAAETAPLLGAVDSAGNAVGGTTLSEIAAPSELPAAATDAPSLAATTTTAPAATTPVATTTATSAPPFQGPISGPNAPVTPGTGAGGSYLSNMMRGGTLPSAVVQGVFQNAGSKRQAQAATDALNYTKQMQAQQQAEAQPYIDSGQAALKQLNALNPGQPPSAYAVPPGYFPQPGQYGQPGGSALSQLGAAPPPPGPGNAPGLAPPPGMAPPSSPAPVQGQPLPGAPTPIQGQPAPPPLAVPPGQSPSPIAAPTPPPVQGPTPLQPASTPPTMSATPQNQTVKMKAPDGTVETVKASDVEHFKSLGATVVTG